MSRADLPEQLVLSLPHAEAVGSEDFLISPSNEAALAGIEAWPQWQLASLALSGPAGSGKSHLVNVWRTRSRAVTLSARDLDDSAVQAATQAGAVAIEDVDRGIGSERVLFHLLNLARETRLSVLVTSRVPPGELDIGLPDLRSRLRAMALVRIGEPDDTLLKGLLIKLFADRQITVEPNVIAYLMLHMDRTMEMARRLVAQIDTAALAQQRRVTRVLAADVLKAIRVGQEGP